MGSQNFMSDFLNGWNQGLRTRAMKNAEEQEVYNRQQDEFRRQQEMEDRALRMENFKIQKQELDLRMKQEKLAAAQQEKAMREQAMALQSQLPTPTAAEVGIPEQAPEFGGPMASEVQVPQPMMPMPSPTGGADIKTPILTGRQQQEMALAEKQAKMREALGLLDEQERIKAQYREKPKTLEEIFAEAKARAAGGRAGAPLAAASGSMTGEGGKPLLSGEIKTFNEFRSGLNTIDRLSGEVEKTGAASKAGTMVPGILTETMGWGADAKARQAVLDQAKQVVGKAMEGGVLRKEDEAKYMRILPVISDPPSVAKAKLANLKEVMAQDAEIYLETLGAAGRDTKKLRDVLDKQLGAPAPASGGKYKIIEVR